MRKILIIHPDAIGDFIVFSAVLEEYPKLYPEYKIVLLCQPKVKELVQQIPFINKTICIDIHKFFRKRYPLYTIVSLIRLIKYRYDKVIYPVYSRTQKGDLLAAMSRAKEKIVFDGDNSNDPNNRRFRRNKYFTRIIKSEKKNIAELKRNAEFINKLGAKPDFSNLKTKIWFSDNDDIEFQRLKVKYNLKENGYIAISPGAGYQIKYWENKKWAELIKQIIDEYPKYKIVISGYGEDIFLINCIFKSLDICYKKKLVNLYNKTALRILAKVIQNAKLFIGLDTGTVHIAAAVGTPNICLMGGADFGRCYPYGDLNKNRIVYKKMDCYGCKWRCKYDTAKCVKEIEVNTAWKEIENILQNK